MKRNLFSKLMVPVAIVAVLTGGAFSVLGVCGPFTDVTDAFFCQYVLEIFYLGITTGTTPTTYDPAASVTRLQMAAFLSRTVDQALKRGNPKASAGKFWTPQNDTVLPLTNITNGAQWAKSDGA